MVAKILKDQFSFPLQVILQGHIDPAGIHLQVIDVVHGTNSLLIHALLVHSTPFVGKLGLQVNTCHICSCQGCIGGAPGMKTPVIDPVRFQQPK